MVEHSVRRRSRCVSCRNIDDVGIARRLSPRGNRLIEALQRTLFDRNHLKSG